MIITRTIEIDYGHTLPNHFSFCNQIHGHRGVITAYVMGDINDLAGDSSEGMVIDFKIVKQLMIDNIHNTLDHGFAVWEKDTELFTVPIGGSMATEVSTIRFIRSRNEKILVTKEPPTAECLAKWAFNVLEGRLKKHKVRLVAVCWQETPNSKAFYGIEDHLNLIPY